MPAADPTADTTPADTTPADASPAMFTIAIDHGPRFACAPETSVLVAMGRQRIRAILAGCHGGGCGICRIRVLEGDFECGRMSRAHVSEEAQADGVALACRTYPRSDLMVTPHPLRPTLRSPAESDRLRPPAEVVLPTFRHDADPLSNHPNTGDI